MGVLITFNMTYSIIKADLKKDKEDILELWKRNFPGVPEERYPWIYENNPSGSARCWLAKNSEENSVVGSVALFPRRILIKGRYLVAGIAGDFSVIKEFRVYGPALSLQREIASNYVNEGFDILYGLPDKQSEEIVKRAGYSAIGNILWLTKPLNSQNYLKKNFKLPLIAEIASKPTDMVMKMLARENFYVRPKDYTYELLTHFDSRFDILWEKAAPQFTIIGEKTCSYLNWRFSRSPHSSYLTFVIKHAETDEILGYIIFSIAQNRANIADILSLNDHTLNSLLSEFLLSLRRECIDSVSISLAVCIDLVRKLQRYGFSIRGREGKLVALFPPDSPFAQYISEIKNWHFMAGDNDI